MEQKKHELDQYREFVEQKTASRCAADRYCRWVWEFLEQHPEAKDLGEATTRELVDNYIKETPMSSTKKVLAASVRYYWSYRFGKPYFQKFRQRDFSRNSGIDDELESFRSFLVTTKHLSKETVVGRVGCVRQLLYTAFGESLFSREAVTIDVVRDYLSHLTPQLSSATKARLATEIRSYASFLVGMGNKDTARAILKLPLSIRIKRHAKLPGRIEGADFCALVDSIDNSTEQGARNLALVLLMGNLGLRASDAVHLDLDDINWSKGELTVRNSKSKTPRTLPLDAESGAAIERYLKDFRPGAHTRRIFLVAGKERSEEGPLSSVQARCSIRRAAEKAGLGRYSGTHTLRRAVASDMVQAGVDIKTLADILGHERIATAMGYVRLNLSSLRKVAAEWPKGVRHV